MTTKYFDNSSSALLSTEIGTLDEQVPVVSETARDFDFHAEHNGEACIESFRPEDRGTERQFWFTVAMLCVIYGVAERTLRDNLESIINDGELVSADFRRDASILDISGVPHKTTIYNLEVLNKLGMCCFRGNKKAKEIRNKFNDVLVKHETGVTQPQTTLAIPKTLPEALRAYADEVERREAAEKRAITAESERDEAVRTKAQIGSRREAKAMATASAKSKECARLTIENAELKDAIGRGNNWHTVSMMTAEWMKEFGHAPSWHKLKKFSVDLPTEMQPIKDVEEKVVLKNGSEKVSKVNRYHIEAWDRYRQYEETIRTDTEIKNV